MLSLDDLKFEALESLVKSRSFSDSNQREDFELTFLEHCDELLVDFFSKHAFAPFEDVELRDDLAQHILSSPEDFSSVSMLELFQDLFETLEELEDVTQSWVSLSFLKLDSVKAVYRQLQEFRTSQDSSGCRLRVQTLLKRSPLFVEEDTLCIQLLLENLDDGSFLFFLNRFFQAQVEYGQAMQGRFAEQNPGVFEKIRKLLFQEARRSAAQV